MSQWSVLMRAWLRVLIVAGSASTAVFFALAIAPMHYTATTELRLPAPASEETRAAAIAALRSRDLARKVIADLALDRAGAHTGAHTGDGEETPALLDIVRWLDLLSGRATAHASTGPDAEALATFARSLEVMPGRTPDTLSITVRAHTPERATRAANHIADIYVATAQPTASVQAKDGPTGIDAEKKRLADEIATIEREIARLKSLSNDPADAQRRSDLAAALAQAEGQRSTAEARARSVRALLEKGRVEAIAEQETSPTLHELIAERVRVEVRKNGAEQTWAADHPHVRDLRTRLSEIRWHMFREATAIAEALDAKVTRAQAREREARANLESADAEAAARTTSSADPARIATLEQEVAGKRGAQAALQARDAAVLADAQTNASAPARAEAAAPRRLMASQALATPAFPQKGQLSLLTAVSILMVGFVAVILRTLLWGSRRSVAETGFADMAATARDRADVRLEGTASPARAGEVAAADVMADDIAKPALGIVEPSPFVILSTTADAARHLAGRGTARKGYRTLLVGDGLEGANEGRDLASSLATSGRRCVLVDWSRDGKGIAARIGAPQQPGINDLLDGRASFDDVIVRLPGSEAHFIAAGTLPVDPGRPLDAGWVNLVLDALDEAYDHIVVVAQFEQAKTLFETIEGRFDAGIMMSDRRAQGATLKAGPGVFLGFEVTEIYIVQMDLAPPRTSARRFKRARRQAA